MDTGQVDIDVQQRVKRACKKTWHNSNDAIHGERDIEGPRKHKPKRNNMDDSVDENKERGENNVNRDG